MTPLYWCGVGRLSLAIVVHVRGVSAGRRSRAPKSRSGIRDVATDPDVSSAAILKYRPERIKSPNGFLLRGRAEAEAVLPARGGTRFESAATAAHREAVRELY